MLNSKKLKILDKKKSNLDFTLLTVIAMLLCIGWVMVASASMPLAELKQRQVFYYAIHQGCFIVLGLLAMYITSCIPLELHKKLNVLYLLFTMLLLVLLLIPGVTRPLNGSLRWFFIGSVSFQPSELIKIAFIFYLAAYMVRREEQLKVKMTGFLIPMSVLGIVTAFLLMEPDFGASVVLVLISLIMIFLGGAHYKRFIALLPFLICTLGTLAISSSYRLQRFISFQDPWKDQFNSGYQLVQSLIAFGRGSWFGVGLGSSVQKLHYLPEAESDFIFAILAEELGLFMVTLVLGLFVVFCFRALYIGYVACYIRKDSFSGYVAYGIGLWIGLQALINIGVNIGLLPTKGLTLPLMSAGGSSLIVMCASIGVLFRIHYENNASLQ